MSIMTLRRGCGGRCCHLAAEESPNTAGQGGG